MKKIILPKDNLRDVDELAVEVKEGLEVIFVETIDQVLDVAFPKNE